MNTPAAIENFSQLGEIEPKPAEKAPEDCASAVARAVSFAGQDCRPVAAGADIAFVRRDF